MGQAKLRKLEIDRMKSQNIVRHITKSHWVNTIINDNMLMLEGNNVDHIPAYMREFNEEQYNLVGRYVWFTTERHAKCAGADTGFAFEFNANDITLEYWPDIVNRLTGKARYLAEVLNITARQRGDNPNKWYVSRNNVSLDKCLNKSDFERMIVDAEIATEKRSEHLKRMIESGQAICIN